MVTVPRTSLVSMTRFIRWRNIGHLELPWLARLCRVLSTFCPSQRCGLQGYCGQLPPRPLVLKELDEVATIVLDDGDGDRSHGGGLLTKHHASARHAFIGVVGVCDR